jgi:dATP pyrophosphohydrolase
MSRAPFQVLVIPFRRAVNNDILYGVFKRSDAEYWQWIAGGGEDLESPIEAARRESFEEAGIGRECSFMELDSSATIPVVGICGFMWGENVLVVPEYSFGVEVQQEYPALSHEHTEFKWVDYETARGMLRWDSNRNALWELNHRLENGRNEL